MSGSSIGQKSVRWSTCTSEGGGGPRGQDDGLSGSWLAAQASTRMAPAAAWRWVPVERCVGWLFARRIGGAGADRCATRVHPESFKLRLELGLRTRPALRGSSARSVSSLVARADWSTRRGLVCADYVLIGPHAAPVPAGGASVAPSGKRYASRLLLTPAARRILGAAGRFPWAGEGAWRLPQECSARTL